MHNKRKDTKSFRQLRKNLLNDYFFDSIANQLFFEKKPAINVKLCCLQRKKKQFLYYFINFYIIFYDFINCPAYVDIKQT